MSQLGLGLEYSSSDDTDAESRAAPMPTAQSPRSGPQTGHRQDAPAVPSETISVRSNASLRPIVLPPSPTGTPSSAASSRIHEYIQQKAHSRSFIENLRSKKEFHDPGILQHIVDLCAIQQYGTNIANEWQLTHRFGRADTCESLATKQSQGPRPSKWGSQLPTPGPAPSNSSQSSFQAAADAARIAAAAIAKKQ